MPLQYAGNDANYATAVNIISGSDAPGSAVFQTGYEGGLDRSAYQQNRGGLSPLVTLGTQFDASTITGTPSGPYAVCFNDTGFATDPVAGQNWLLLVWGASTTVLQVFYGFGDGTPWTQVGGNVTYSQSGTSMCVDSAGNIYIAGVSGLTATEADIYKCAPLGSFASNLVISGVSGLSDLQIATLGTALFYAVGSSTASNASVSGGSGGGFTALTVSKWIVRSSPTMVLFIPASTAGSNGIAYKATGTATFSSAAIALGSTDVPQDLAWSAAWNLWFLVVKTSTGGTTIWSSPDGASWTLVKSMTTLPHPTTGIAAVGPHLIAVIDATPTGGVGAPSRLLTSSDGGVTWYAEQTGVLEKPGMFGVNPNRVIAAPNQIMSVAMVPRSNVTQPYMRFSAIMGRGDQAIT